MNRWVGKVAVVTGASAGIGAVLAEKLVKEGLQVVGLARREEPIKSLSKKLQGQKGKLYALKVDLSKPDEIINAFKWVKDNLGPVHILVNNAGLAINDSLSDGNYESWKQVLDVNVLGLSVATREAVKQMKENKIDGHIVHVNSILGHRLVTMPGLNMYPASKYAVTALTETLLNEFNQKNLKIKISSVSPGVVKTDFRRVAGYTPQNAEENFPGITSEEVADAIIYVLSTPPTVQIRELILTAVGESFQ
ncbi:farnesol dehydrogenase [Agrilus planipennis]|uniref:Farnesol dehydrogenase n=1 Tax=Agrilus planipennis TaxID=224129 RepID=A0A1W4WZ46_AGRPL|nr:farnesol dehydrogenase [Agrilus planipennis]